MKKVTILSSIITALSIPVQALAQAPSSIVVAQPDKGFKSLGNAISNLITIALAIAIIVVLVMLIQGAFEWIVSGGDKESVGKARSRIVNAIIGLIVLAVAFALARVSGQIAGFDLSNLVIPTPASSPAGL